MKRDRGKKAWTCERVGGGGGVGVGGCEGESVLPEIRVSRRSEDAPET